MPNPVGGGNELFRVEYGYDTFGRLGSLTYPTVPGAAALTISYGYDDYGHVTSISEAGQPGALWTLDQADAVGRIALERFANGVGTLRIYPDAQNPLSNLYSETSGGAAVQDLHYEYNENRTLRQRVDRRQANAVEDFSYDSLERLYQSSIGGVTRTFFLYDGIGNMSLNSSVGFLQYDPARPHVLASTGDEGAQVYYGHDAVGRQTQRPGNVEIVYNDHDQPAELKQDGLPVATFAYDGRGVRARKETDDEVVTYAAGLFERRQKSDGSVEHVLRVLGPAAHITDGLARPLVEFVYQAPTPTAAPTRTTRFVHSDPLGSLDVLTDAQGAPLETKSYEAFGAPRNADWHSGQAPAPSLTSLGFTGHEDDRELGLVNMRGRVYDPALARFLQPDPLVQAPSFSGNWNPYAYAFHSPLRYTDPSGFTVAPPPAPAPPVTPPSPPPPTTTERTPAPPPSDFPVVGPWGNGVETTGPAPYGAQPQAAPPPPPSQPSWATSVQIGGNNFDLLWYPGGLSEGPVRAEGAGNVFTQYLLKSKRRIERPSNRYRDVQEAAIEALRYYDPWSIEHNREADGLVYQRKDGSFGFAGINPIKSILGEHHAVHGLYDKKIRSQVPAGARVVANFHTHGADWSTEQVVTVDESFSPDDLDLGRVAAGLRPEVASLRPPPSWVPDPAWREYLATPTGRVLEFIPRSGQPPSELGKFPHLRP